MPHYLHVNCLTNRFWDPETKDWDGTLASGTLIEISTQSDEGNNDRTIPVGIVVLEDGTFEAIPMQFMSAIPAPVNAA
ncbi:MAG: hypothetical protein FWC77_04115 [Defluviitaleaceae bacterium]|nr:hypothetical protein [Defluviitaleaceae bacterium]